MYLSYPQEGGKMGRGKKGGTSSSRNAAELQLFLERKGKIMKPALLRLRETGGKKKSTLVGLDLAKGNTSVKKGKGGEPRRGKSQHRTRQEGVFLRS